MMEKSDFEVFIKYIHIFMWLSEWDGGPIFVIDPGPISRFSGPRGVYYVSSRFVLVYLLLVLKRT
jgi:hypothetical protein